MEPIYLDNNATTCVDPEIVEAMLPFFSEQFGNPSSIHSFGNKVGRAIKNARRQVQKLLEMRFDCDGDALLLTVDQVGPACHTGRRSCFYHRVDGESVVIDSEPLIDPEELYGK